MKKRETGNIVSPVSASARPLPNALPLDDAPNMPTVPDRITLTIRTADDAYAIRLILPDGSTAGEARLDLAALLGELQAHELSHPVWQSQDPAAFGRILYRYLFPDPIGFHYAQAVGAAGYRGVQLLLDLDAHAPELHRIPWERLFQPGAAGWKPAGASPGIFLSRFLPSDAAWQTPLGRGPLRMLVVISNPYPEGHPRHFHGDAAWEALAMAVAPFADRVMLDRMEGPITVERLARTLAQGEYHILHYTGHGAWDESQGRAFLILEREENGRVLPDQVAAEDLIARWKPLVALPMLITLAACESAFPGTKDALSGLAPQLILAGCPAVVGMQEEVRVEAAHAFYQAFYGALFKDGFVDQAVTRGRAALYRPDSWEWAIPALTMRLADGLLFLPDEQFRPKRRHPYKFLAPYTAADTDIFKGRDALARRVFLQVQDYRVTVLYGEPGAGITSLLEAGVRPKLEEAGDLVVRVDEYDDIASEVRLHARWQGRPLRLPLRGDAPLDEVLRAITGHTGRRIVLALDQFERAFSLSRSQLDALADEVVAALAALGQRLKLIIALHVDYLGDFAALQERFEAIAQPWIQTPVLSRDAAAEAIVGPLEALGWPVSLQPEFARQQIARDLDALYAPEKEPPGGSVHPGQLQIVCTWLYDAARRRSPPQIDETLYVQEVGGAEGILARYMEQTLSAQLADVRALAEAILVQMAAPHAPIYIHPENLHIPDAEPEQIAAVLERLAEAKLLIQRRREGRPAYAFANVIVAQEARYLGGEALRLRYLAEDELERIWRMWIAAVAEEDDPASPADQALPRADQLALLARTSDSLHPLPVQAFMLLRAAVQARDITLHPWLEWLHGEDAVALLAQLDAGDEEVRSACGAVAVDRASRLLGLIDTPRGDGDSVLARAAALHPDPTSRQTAALALSALSDDASILASRLKAALHASPNGLTRWRRASQLFGILADAGILTPSAHLGFSGRLGAWGWRVWRRLVNQRHVLAALTAGAAVGAGILFALFRGLSAAATIALTPGIQFGVGLWWGIIMGTFLALGLSLPDFLLLRIPRPSSPARSTWLFNTLSGGASFALAIVIISGFAVLSSLFDAAVWLRLLRTAPRVFLAALPAGLGLALTLADHPWTCGRLTPRIWLLRPIVLLAASSVTFLALRYVDLSTFTTADSLPGVGLAGDLYAGFFTQFAALNRLQQTRPAQFELFKTMLGLGDLFLTLLTVFWGALLGMRRAAKEAFR